MEKNKSTQKQGKFVSRYLRKIGRESTPGIAYVYRGQANARWPLKSGAARRIIASARQKDDGWLLSKSMVEYHDNLLIDARQKGFGLVDGRRLPDLELLTELQHFGAATCLLDFTESVLVALYFACQPEKDMKAKEAEKAGKIFCVSHSNIAIALEDNEKKKNIHISEKQKTVSMAPNYAW